VTCDRLWISTPMRVDHKMLCRSASLRDRFRRRIIGRDMGASVMGEGDPWRIRTWVLRSLGPVDYLASLKGPLSCLWRMARAARLGALALAPGETSVV
jgi:hypothetical protein